MTPELYITVGLAFIVGGAIYFIHGTRRLRRASPHGSLPQAAQTQHRQARKQILLRFFLLDALGVLALIKGLSDAGLLAMG